MFLVEKIMDLLLKDYVARIRIRISVSERYGYADTTIF